MQNLEFAEDATTVILPVHRVELHDGKMLAYMDGAALEEMLMGRGTVVAPATRGGVGGPPAVTEDAKKVARLMRDAASQLDALCSFGLLDDLEAEDRTHIAYLCKELPRAAEQFYSPEQSLADQGFPSKADGTWPVPPSPETPDRC